MEVQKEGNPSAGGSGHPPTDPPRDGKGSGLPMAEPDFTGPEPDPEPDPNRIGTEISLWPQKDLAVATERSFGGHREISRSDPVLDPVLDP